MAKKESSGCGCLAIIVLVTFFFTSPYWIEWSTTTWILIVVGLVVLMILGAKFAEPSNCQICGNVLKRNKYVWNLGRKKKVVCSHCNRRLESEQSRDAFRNR